MFGETVGERKIRKLRKQREFERRARLAKRDLDYAVSGCAARVTVEERDGLRIETRGVRCIGSRAGMICQPDTRPANMLPSENLPPSTYAS